MTQRVKRAVSTLAVLLTFSLATPGYSAQTTSRKPNVVLIYADDLGYADLSSYGNRFINTKHIDSVGAGGIKFSNSYVTAPLCSPSRAGLITGRYQQRFGWELQITNGAFPEREALERARATGIDEKAALEELETRGVPTSELNLAEVLKSGGYKTGVVGKWHLGHAAPFQPQNRGFDYSFVFYGNTSLQEKDLNNPNIINVTMDNMDQQPDQLAWTREGLNAIRENGKIVDVSGYLMWAFRDKARQFIDEHKQDPFFLYVAINAPVPPLQVPKEYYDRVGPNFDPLGLVKDDNQRAYNAFLLAYDDAIGGILDRIKSDRLEQNTLVIFISDHGSALTRGSNAPFIGGKSNTREGGIRVPYMIKWPARFKGGQINDLLVSTLDILPTVAAAANVPLPPGKKVDGVNLLPYLDKAKSGNPHDILYWKFGNFAAVRKGNWKLFINTAANIMTLHNLELDYREQIDLSKQEPEIFNELQAAYKNWTKELPPRRY